MADRAEANRNTCGIPPGDWAAMSRNQRKRAVSRARRQAVACPTCGDPVPGLLAGCAKDACRTAAHAYDAQLDARCDRD
jgi:hypothetical protein